MLDVVELKLHCYRLETPENSALSDARVLAFSEPSMAAKIGAFCSFQSRFFDFEAGLSTVHRN